VRARLGDADATLDVRALPLLVGGAATPEAVRAPASPRATSARRTLAALAAGVTPFQALNDRF
jgi:hypothetical protein